MKAKLVVLTAALITAVGLSMPAHALEHFTWGVEAGASVDVSGNDLSALGIDAYFGWKGSVFDIVGVGAGIDMALSNSSRAIPVFAIVRAPLTPLTDKLFIEMRGGVAFDNMHVGPSHTVAYLNPSVGLDFVRTKRFNTYVAVGYVYNGLKSYGPADDPITTGNGISSINFRLGIRF